MELRALPSDAALRRAAFRLGHTNLTDVVQKVVIDRWGARMAAAEALLHEAAHYRVAGGALVEELYYNDEGGVRSKTRLCRVSPKMFDSYVTERSDSVSMFVADAYELDTCATVQLAGAQLKLWNYAARNPAQANIVARLKKPTIAAMLTERRASRFIQGCAEDVATWWRMVFK